MHLALDGKSVSVYTLRPKDKYLVRLRHFFDYFLADFTHDFAVHNAGEVIRQNGFPVVYPAMAEDILVHDIGNKVRGQVAAVNQAFARLLYVLHQLSERMLHFHRRTERLKIVAAVPFKKVSVLVRRLHSEATYGNSPPYAAYPSR